MKRLLFWGIFVPCLLSAAAVLGLSAAVSEETAFVPWLLAPAVSAAAAYALAALLARRLAKPINALSLDKPAQSAVYAELAPFFEGLAKQQRNVAEQTHVLLQKQREFAVITENMSEGFLVIDKNAEILSYNGSALRLLGALSPGQKKPPKSALALSRSAAFLHAVESALSGEKNEQTWQRNERSYNLIASPVREGSGNAEEAVAGAVLLVLDVTERLERESLRREFTTNVSHELKTPLTSISGFAEIIKTGLVREEDVSRFAGRIYDEAQRLIVLVGDIIKLSQLDENSVPFEKVPVDLYELAGRIIAQLSDAASSKSVSLYRAGERAAVMGVPQILEEMLFNLCDNAIKYNKEKGSVTITIETTPAGVVLSVADTGIGIPDDLHDRVFERFYRAEKSHSREIDGTGLGLSIVKHGAAFHGAAVSLESTQGKGTKVTISWKNSSQSA